MSDPAVEAAQRASDQYEAMGQISLQAVAAAREALKPLQEKSEELDATFGGSASDVAAGVRLVLAQIRPLIYSHREGKP